MTPHATSSPPTYGNNELPSTTHDDQRYTFIPPTDSHELHDLICIGFGPAALAIAAALHDRLEERATCSPQAPGRLPKVVFLEQQEEFRWHAGMQLPGATMQISWIKDLATLRNPRSQFTFLNYLHSVGRLISFTNLGTLLPLRMEYEDYMKWCASWFDRLVEYRQEARQILPNKSQYGEEITSLQVISRNIETGQIETKLTRHVVIAAGGTPRIPPHLLQSHPRVIHSSAYLWAVPKILAENNAAYKVVVIGAGQSAAEIFHDLHSRYPHARTRLMIKGSALKPSDDSPFVNEVFEPSRVDEIFHRDPDIRALEILENKATNYGVVRLELLEKIYHDLYVQKVHQPDTGKHQHQILPHREVTQIDEIPNSNLVRVHVHNSSGQYNLKETVDADAVIVAAGYERNIHETLLADMRSIMPLGGRRGEKWTVRRDYGVEFQPGAVSSDAGIWLQGCNEATHGLSDSLLSILSIRGGEMIDSIFGSMHT